MAKRIIVIFQFTFLISAFFLPVHSALSNETVKFEAEISENLTKPVDAAISPNGDLLILDEWNAAVLIFEKNGAIRSFFGSAGSTPGQFLNPRAIAATLQDRIVVADSGNNRIQVFGASGELMFYFGTSGSSPGQFKFLSDVSVDAFGFIYAADRDNKRVQIFTPNGIFVKEFNLASRPQSLDVDAVGRVYVLLAEAAKIEIFTFEGKRIGEVLPRENKDEYTQAQYLEVDSRGDIYLTVPGEERVIKVDKNGNLLLSFGSEGSNRGQFLGVGGMISDESGMVYIADGGNKRLQTFKVAGPKKSLLKTSGNSPLMLDFDSSITAEDGLSDLSYLSGKGLFAVSDKKAQILVRESSADAVYSGEGNGVGQLFKPGAIMVTLDGRIFIADTGNNRIEIFNPDGSVNYAFGKAGTKTGQFSAPAGIAVNSKGMIYVSDTLNNRVQIFNQDGIFLSAIAGQPAVSNKNTALKDGDLKTFRSPKSLAIDSQDRVYVLDVDTSRVVVFDDKGEYLRVIQPERKFEKPVDIALDENDNLYVADQSNGSVQIFDRNGNGLLSFGSLGVGGGYFKQISSVAAASGKIFVADYASDQIQVFRYAPEGLLTKPERFFSTRTAAPPPGFEGNDVLRYNAARRTATRQAVNELTDNLGFSNEYISQFVRFESIEAMNDGRVTVTVSIPKNIPKEINLLETPSDTGGQR